MYVYPTLSCDICKSMKEIMRIFTLLISLFKMGKIKEICRALEDEMYFNPRYLLPYKRNFNFVNAVRSVGKTYSPTLFFINEFLEKGVETVYICRTVKEKEKGKYLENAIQKVMNKEFRGLEYKSTGNEIIIHDKVALRCIALSEAIKIKKNAYPNVKYMFLDEYAIEENGVNRYVTGWDEPDLLLNIYHTVDREEDRVILFAMGNNISAYNPYHLHKAFKIPYIEKGKVFMSDNVLFLHYEKSEKLQEKTSDCKFLNMIKDTDYGKFAGDGEYIYDNNDLIYNYPLKYCRYFCTLKYNGKIFGVWNYNIMNWTYYITESINPTMKDRIAITPNDINKDYSLLTKTDYKAQTLRKAVRTGNLHFQNMKLKKYFTEIIPYFL